MAYISNPSMEDLRSYYDQAKFEFNFASLCKLTLPEDMQGMRVLDVGCRRGKGVFKLSDRVGNTGVAVGLEWVPAYVEEAAQRSERAWKDSGLEHNNMSFVLAYPESMIEQGVQEASFDAVVINSVLNLCCNPHEVIAQIARALKPGGLLVCESVFADAQRDEGVLNAARLLGNSIQSALSFADFEAALCQNGFSIPEYSNKHEVEPQQGYKEGFEVEVASSAEDIHFFACVAHARLA